MHHLVSKYLTDLELPPDALDGWVCSIATRAGKDVALTIVRGCEIHFCSLTERPAVSRKNVREAMQPVLAEFGYVTTRVPIAITDHRLREKLGFSFTWADHDFNYFSATALPFEKAPK